MTAARPLVIDPAENLPGQGDGTVPHRAAAPDADRVADPSSRVAAGPGGPSTADPAPDPARAAPALGQPDPAAGQPDLSAGQPDPAARQADLSAGDPAPAAASPAPAPRTSAPAAGQSAPSPVAAFVAPPPDPALAEGTVPYLPRGVRLADDFVRGMRVLQAPERAMQLDPVGEAILSALDGRPLGAVIDGLAAAYSAPRDQIAGDVTAFLQGLIDRRMVFVRLP